MNGDTLVMVDINLNFMNWDQLAGNQRKLADLVTNRITTIGFTQSVMDPTHRKGNSESLIDHSWANCPRRIVEIINRVNGYSDHDVIITRLRSKHLDLSEKISYRRT